MLKKNVSDENVLAYIREHSEAAVDAYELYQRMIEYKEEFFSE